MSKKETYEDGHRMMAAEILLILAAGAGKTGGMAGIIPLGKLSVGRLTEQGNVWSNQ